MTQHMIVHSPEEVVWKWVVPIGDRHVLRVPKGTRFLPHAELTEQGAEVWGIVHGGSIDDLVERVVHMRGTGHRMNEIVGARYLATTSITLNTGAKFVVHLFVTPTEGPISG